MRSKADFVALLLSLLVLAGSWLWELKRWLERRQKNRADAYRANASTNPTELAEIRQELMKILTVSVCDLDEDRISEESFQSLRVVWQIAADAVRERHAILEATAKAAN